MPRPEWLAKTIETPLEPELPIIDPHHHLWDMDPATWGRYLADDLVEDVTAGHRVVGTVFQRLGPAPADSGDVVVRDEVAALVPQGDRVAGVIERDLRVGAGA